MTVVSRQSSIVSEQPANVSDQADTIIAIRALMQAARRLEEQNKLESAVEVYRQAQSLAAAEPTLHTELDAIIQHLCQRLAAAPFSATHSPTGTENEGYLTIQALFEKGWTAYQAGDWIQAEQWLEKVVQQQPNYNQGNQQAWVLLELARQFRKSKNPEFQRVEGEQWQLLKIYRTQRAGLAGWLLGALPLEAVAFSPDSRWMGACTVGKIWVWSLEQETPPLILEESDLAFSLAFSPDSSLLVAGSTVGNIKKWRMPNGFGIDSRSYAVEIWV